MSAFDPRAVPVVSVDRHLPAIAPRMLAPQALTQCFAKPAHGWVPEIVQEPLWVDRAPIASAVLIPLVMREQMMVLLTQRTAQLSSHAGQIAFPGGRADAEDDGLVATALREAFEEVGLHAHFVRVLGQLPVYMTGSAYAVTPVVGLLQPGFVLQPNQAEVADMFEVPLAFLMDPANHRRHVRDVNGIRREWFSMPYVDGASERYIWGATAGMLRNLYGFLRAAALSV